MLAIAQLGDARSDIVSTLSVIMGQAKAEAFFKDFEGLIESKAKAGATEAIPSIEAKVRAAAAPAAKAAVMPFVLGAMVIGGLGALFGTVALIRSRR